MSFVEAKVISAHGRLRSRHLLDHLLRGLAPPHLLALGGVETVEHGAGLVLVGRNLTNW